jgi:DNA-binding transcriptional LysR family regulator
MDTLQHINARTLQLFVAIIDTGNFSEVARREGIAASTVSRMLQQMEQALGSQLFYRNTRAVIPTEAGRLFAQYARAMLEQLHAAQTELQEQELEPRGLIRINAPVVFGQRHITPWLGELHARYPALQVDLMQTDDYIDPHQQPTDLIFRIGVLADSSNHARIIARQQYHLAATPAYVHRHGWPQTPDDLSQHQCLIYRGTVGLQRWFFRQNTEEWQQYPLTGTLTSNNAETLLAAALQHMGIVLFPDWLIGDRLQNQTLVRLLPDWDAAITLEPLSLALLYPNSRRPALKVRAVIDFFVEKYGSPVYWHYK